MHIVNDFSFSYVTSSEYIKVVIKVNRFFYGLITAISMYSLRETFKTITEVTQL